MISFLLACHLFSISIYALSTKPASYIGSIDELKQKRLNSQAIKCNKYNQFECVSRLHGIQCIPNKQRCDGEYQCKDESDERHCYLKYSNHFDAKCKNSHGSYAPYAMNDIFDDILDSGEISIAPNDFLECDIKLYNITNLDIVKFTFEGVASYAQMISDNIELNILYLQANEWIKMNSTYYDHDSTQLNTVFITEKNERGIYTNNIKFKIKNMAPKMNKEYKFIKNEYLHIIAIRLYGNYMPFYCPTNLITKWSLFTKQYAEWKYIQTYKLCDDVNDCIDGSDEIICPQKNNHKKVDSVSVAGGNMAYSTCSEMKMYFHWSVNECILFQQWNPKNGVQFLFSCIILFLLCLTREQLIYTQKYFELTLISGRSLPYWPSKKISSTGHIKVSYNNKIMSRYYINRRTVTYKFRIIDCILHGLSQIIGYGLMLTIMTFNLGIMTTIILGYCCARFVFRRRTEILFRSAFGTSYSYSQLSN